MVQPSGIALMAQHKIGCQLRLIRKSEQSSIQALLQSAGRCTYRAIPGLGYVVGGAYLVDHLLFNIMHSCDDSSHHGNKHCRRLRCEFHNRSVPVPYNSYTYFTLNACNGVLLVLAPVPNRDDSHRAQVQITARLLT